MWPKGLTFLGGSLFFLHFSSFRGATYLFVDFGRFVGAFLDYLGGSGEHVWMICWMVLLDLGNKTCPETKSV